MSASAAFAIAIVALLMLICSVVMRISIFLCWPCNMLQISLLLCLYLERLTILRYHMLGYLLLHLLLSVDFSDSLRYENGQVFRDRLTDFFSLQIHEAHLPTYLPRSLISPSSVERPGAVTPSIKSSGVGESGRGLYGPLSFLS